MIITWLLQYIGTQKSLVNKVMNICILNIDLLKTLTRKYINELQSVDWSSVYNATNIEDAWSNLHFTLINVTHKKTCSS